MRRRYLYQFGSSPRLRGTGNQTHRPGLSSRFIPAPAGNRSLVKAIPISVPVHPRACGEQALGWVIAGIKFGSSPRLRGTETLAATAFIGLRFIPAPAGNSQVPSGDPCAHTVHPRACGEQNAMFRWDCSGYGSSPRLRGTDQPYPWASWFDRFIPAPAGNRPLHEVFSHGFTVHPRACGEQTRPAYRSRWTDGSSPRLRGTGLLIGVAALQGRFIPAPAGNSTWRKAGSGRRPVHPRACGEQ